MSEKAEKLRLFYETALNRLDFDDAVQYLHPESEIRPAFGGHVDIGRRYRGRDEAKQLLKTLTEGVEGVEGVEKSIDDGETFLASVTQVEPKETIEIGGDRLLRVERWRPRGWQGIETEVEITHLYTFRDGLIARIDGFRDKAEALQAAGLSE